MEKVTRDTRTRAVPARRSDVARCQTGRRRYRLRPITRDRGHNDMRPDHAGYNFVNVARRSHASKYSPRQSDRLVPATKKIYVNDGTGRTREGNPSIRAPPRSLFSQWPPGSQNRSQRHSHWKICGHVRRPRDRQTTSESVSAVSTANNDLSAKNDDFRMRTL